MVQLYVSDQRREMIRQAAFSLVENIKMILNSRDKYHTRCDDDVA